MIEPFVANVHNIMYWIVIVLKYNTDITDICKQIEKKKILNHMKLLELIFSKWYFLDSKYMLIRTHIFKVICSRFKVYVFIEPFVARCALILFKVILSRFRMG